MSINNTTTTGGFYGVNGNLNIQGAITASSFSYYDSSGISHDITQSLENAVDTVTNQTIGGTKTFSNQIVLNNGSTTLKASGLYYIPFSYGGLITLSGSFTSLLTGGLGGNNGTLNNWYHIKTTYTGGSPPVLSIPDPVSALNGCEIKFVKCGASNPLNFATTSGTTSSNFLISPNSSYINPTFSLSGTWNKIGFVCLPNPDGIAGTYAWNQILYQ